MRVTVVIWNFERLFNKYIFFGDDPIVGHAALKIRPNNHRARKTEINRLNDARLGYLTLIRTQTEQLMKDGKAPDAPEVTTLIDQWNQMEKHIDDLTQEHDHDPENIYISWWALNVDDAAPWKDVPRHKTRTYKEEKLCEGMSADRKIDIPVRNPTTLAGIDGNKLLEWWARFDQETEFYNLGKWDCGRVVAQALIAMGFDEYVPVKIGTIFTPSDCGDWAEKIRDALNHVNAVVGPWESELLPKFGRVFSLKKSDLNALTKGVMTSSYWVSHTGVGFGSKRHSRWANLDQLLERYHKAAKYGFLHAMQELLNMILEKVFVLIARMSETSQSRVPYVKELFQQVRMAQAALSTGGC